MSNVFELYLFKILSNFYIFTIFAQTFQTLLIIETFEIDRFLGPIYANESTRT
jgi:hypothetical protein